MKLPDIELEACVICDEIPQLACECGNFACTKHWDKVYGICKRCSDGPSEPDYDSPGASEIAERQDRIQRTLKR